MKDENQNIKEKLVEQFIQQKITKERKVSNLNYLKISQQWRSLLRDVKSKELQKELEILKQTFQRVLDRKETVIASLQKDHQDHDLQHDRIVNGHLQNLDKLIEIERERVQNCYGNYLSRKKKLGEEFGSSEDRICICQQKDMSNLVDVTFAMEQQFLEAEGERKAELQSKKDDLKDKIVEEKQTLQVVLEGYIEGLWQQFQEALQGYTESTESRRKAFEELKAKDEQNARQIDVQKRKLQSISDKISQLKFKISMYAKDDSQEDNVLKKEKIELQNSASLMKDKIKEIQEKEKYALKKMVTQSDGIIQKLSIISSEAENILKSYERCRKLETEEEKVLPFYTSSEEEIEVDIFKQTKNIIKEEAADYPMLENFWKKHNKVLLETLALQKECQDYENENKFLKKQLSDYFVGLNKDSEKTNPLLVINQQFDPPQKLEQQRPVIIEAAHIIQHITE
ncbi:coiled-coil domain-containing protein 65-like [Limulus polyphemus]|uniref:Dynein regulatory complex subunit 2 n=1 Tax=Limulus polyphemus TaxID=6850 RepID=A0ABM1B6I9_LIMPO|nr:coiled-coil domain-containing protein 65-like [Limulus polyphemus]